jgi:hypothetical protein
VAVIFPRWSNWIIPFLFGIVGPIATVSAVGALWYWGSPEFTDVGYAPEQPIPYSHKLHAGELGIDCVYCHNTVEQGAAAAVPPVETCMNCHKAVKTDSEVLAPVRAAYETGEAIAWKRVHLLPDYAYFDHSVHVAATIGCVTCHGRVDQMKTVKQEKSLSMGWCLDCHRDPAQNMRPATELTNMSWTPDDSPDFDPHAEARFPTPPEHCSGCHR